MLAIRCTHCDQFSFSGFENEYGEQFCSKECYVFHCIDNHYDIDLEKIKPIIELNLSR